MNIIPSSKHILEKASKDSGIPIGKLKTVMDSNIDFILKNTYNPEIYAFSIPNFGTMYQHFYKLRLYLHSLYRGSSIFKGSVFEESAKKKIPKVEKMLEKMIENKNSNSKTLHFTRGMYINRNFTKEYNIIDIQQKQNRYADSKK